MPAAVCGKLRGPGALPRENRLNKSDLLKELRIDCDADTVLVKVEQVGGIACHTGRRSCFYQRLEEGAWRVTDAVIKQPSDIYGNTP